MKLPIKKEYFDKIKNGEKIIEYRDAHITFVCIETGETLRRDVRACGVDGKRIIPEEIRDSPMFEDDRTIWFEI